MSVKTKSRLFHPPPGQRRLVEGLPYPRFLTRPDLSLREVTYADVRGRQKSPLRNFQALSPFLQGENHENLAESTLARLRKSTALRAAAWGIQTLMGRAVPQGITLALFCLLVPRQWRRGGASALGSTFGSSALWPEPR